LIFVTVGTQKFPFDRLFIELDNLVDSGKINEEIIAQIGFSKYKPKNYESFAMVDSTKMNEFIDKASILITHGGTSSIIQGLKKEKKVLVVPRRKKYGEHVDDHQVEIAQMFYDLGFIEIVNDIKELYEKLCEINNKEYKKYESDKSLLLNSISEYLERLWINKLNKNK
jgi:UDP-N-acetylglucosamine transferase subunit ALG13